MTKTETTEETLSRLADRAEITDLMLEFARALDERDWPAYADLYADEGVLELPWGAAIPKSHLAGGTEHELSRYTTTQHLMTNQQVSVTGDTATSRSYLLGVHVYDPERQDGLWVGGVRYDNEYVRTPEGWKFKRVRLTELWRVGEPPEWTGR
jgi:3-phenylpropionate/cinnamic acid dioxygenase small subunit